MGQMLRATCECGYQSSILLVGGGMMNFTTFCGFPALCESCKELRVVNVLAGATECHKCGGPVRLYLEPDLLSPVADEDQQPTVFCWNLPSTGQQLSLLDADYLCPRCGKMSLRFSSEGNWD